MKNKMMKSLAALTIIVIGASYATSASAYMARGNAPQGAEQGHANLDIPVGPSLDIPVGPTN